MHISHNFVKGYINNMLCTHVRVHCSVHVLALIYLYDIERIGIFIFISLHLGTGGHKLLFVDLSKFRLKLFTRRLNEMTIFGRWTANSKTQFQLSFDEGIMKIFCKGRFCFALDLKFM